MKKYMIWCGALGACAAAICVLCIFLFGGEAGPEKDAGPGTAGMGEERGSDKEERAAGQTSSGEEGKGSGEEAAEIGKSDSSSAGQASAGTDTSSAGTSAASAGKEGASGNSGNGGNAAEGTGEAPDATPSGEEAEDAGSGSPGALSLEGTQLVDGTGNPVQLRGISTHGLSWYPEYVNQECFRQLREEWGMNVVRLAMYTAESGGYCTGGDREALKDLVKKGVEYASACGMYAIIDWHILSDGNPNTYLEEAKEFFAEMSKAYGEADNVLYEICNEPNGGVSWKDVKSYAEQVIGTIRENDPDGIILVGTPNWCQYIDQAAADPIVGYDNIMYTLHFYAATHTDSLRSAMGRAVEAGLPVFVSEYGICDASGNGAIDEGQADRWVEAMDGYGISYVAWNLSNKAESSAILKSGCGRTSGFALEDLSDSGRWLLGMLERSGAAGGLSGAGNAENGTGAGNGPGAGNAGNEGGTGAGNAGSGSEPGGGNSEIGSGTGAGDSIDTGNAGGIGTPPGDAGTEGGDSDDPAARPAGGAAEAEGLEVEAKVVNSWGQGDETCFQYELTLTNVSETQRDGWTVRLTFSCDIALQNGWNGKYEVQGNVLTISSMDYNGRMEEGGRIEGVGFIIQAKESCSLDG